MSGPLHHARRRGGVGKSTQSEGAGRGSARAGRRGRRDARAGRQPGRRRRSARSCSRARSSAGPPRPRRCCSPPPAPTMSAAPSARRWNAAPWVVCDRFLDSSIAYQGMVGGVGVEAIRRLHDVGSHGFLPDRTLLLRLDAMEAPRGPAPATRMAATASARATPTIMRRSTPPSTGSPPRNPALPHRRCRRTAEEVTARLLAAVEDLL